MLRKRINSAIFIDYENVRRNALVNSLRNWISWLEEGEFDQDKRPRRFIEKRVYVHPADEALKPAFEENGFDFVVCDRIAVLKNSADIRIALDMIEASDKNRKIKEFILFSSDSDFIPVIQKLGSRNKQTAVIIDPKHERIYSAYKYQADTLISLRELLQATSYVKRPKKLLGLFGWMSRDRGASEKPAESNGREPPPVSPNPVLKAEEPKAEEEIDLAAKLVVQLARSNPKQEIGRSTINRKLSTLKGYTTQGSKAFLGFGNYKALMTEIAGRTGSISIANRKGGGIAVKYKPKQE